MVSEDPPSNTLHHFFIPNSMAANQRQFADHHFGDAYGGVDSISNGGQPYHHSLPSAFLGGGIAGSVVEESDMRHDARLMDLLGVSNDAAAPARMLSLSLGSASCRQANLDSAGLLDHVYRDSCDPGFDRAMSEYSFTGNAFAAPATASVTTQCCSTSYGTGPFTGVIGGSKYLKPAQSLLEEMVCVGGRDIDESNRKYVEKLSGLAGRGSIRLSSELKAEFPNLPYEQAAYVNLIKLLTLLEEVERRYEEYHRHLDDTVSSFEVIAGLGAGRSYTALALQAMSKHFSSLRKVIMDQVRAAKQRVEKDMPKISATLSQLNLLDQNRVTLQQLGIMHNSRQAYRPIRGLPENSVTILRAWLFEHFLHPYPLDSEKLMLASQTGLSKNQVSNWFINARVRLWKPMIEEMYKDEFGELSTESDHLMGSSCIREGAGDSAQDLN